MRLSENFDLSEFVASDYAARKGIINMPDDDALDNLQDLAAVLEAIRAKIGAPVRITSGYRCAELNEAIGGSPTSDHMFGLAADIVSPQFGPPLSLCKAIATMGLRFDQCIHEFGAWCHIGIGRRMRQELLTIDRTGVRKGLWP